MVLVCKIGMVIQILEGIKCIGIKKWIGKEYKKMM